MAQYIDRSQIFEKKWLSILNQRSPMLAVLRLAVDEPTDIGDIAQLCIWIQCIDTVNFEIKEALLSLQSLHDHTRGEIYTLLFAKTAMK